MKHKYTTAQLVQSHNHYIFIVSVPHLSPWSRPPMPCSPTRFIFGSHDNIFLYGCRGPKYPLRDFIGAFSKMRANYPCDLTVATVSHIMELRLLPSASSSLIPPPYFFLLFPFSFRLPCALLLLVISPALDENIESCVVYP